MLISIPPTGNEALTKTIKDAVQDVHGSAYVFLSDEVVDHLNEQFTGQYNLHIQFDVDDELTFVDFSPERKKIMETIFDTGREIEDTLAMLLYSGKIEISSASTISIALDAPHGKWRCDVHYNVKADSNLYPYERKAIENKPAQITITHCPDTPEDFRIDGKWASTLSVDEVRDILVSQQYERERNETR